MMLQEDARILKHRIKSELKLLGCTQKDLAHYLGISEKHISQIMTGRIKGSNEILDRMAKAIGIEL